MTVASSITDASGNPLGSNTTWTFTTQPTDASVFTQNSLAGFDAGTTGTGTYVSQANGGEVILAPTEGADFTGTALPSDWSAAAYASGGGATVGSGVLTVNGARAGTNSLYGPGSTLEFEATFSGDPYQDIGFGLDLNNPPWAIFSTGSGGALYAETGVAGNMSSTLIPGNWLGSAHDFKIVWTTSAVTYFIDGTQVASASVSITSSMRPMVSDYNVGGGSVTVAWMHLSPYASTGSYVSQVFDAGSPATWSKINWTDSTSAATSVTMMVRMGNTATPDSTWTDWIPMSASGANIGGASRYMQYEAILSTTDPNQTPALENVSISYNFGADTVPPTLISSTPAANASNVSLLSGVTLKFSELMNAATISNTSFYLEISGTSTLVPATVTYSGSTAILQPSVALAANTTYEVVVASTITDSSGNVLGTVTPWTFTTGIGVWQQSTAADFNLGTLNGVQIASASTGGLELATVFQDSFAGTALSSSWNTTSWRQAAAGRRASRLPAARCRSPGPRS